MTWFSDQSEFNTVFANTFDYPLRREQFVEIFVTSAGFEKDRLCYKWMESGQLSEIVSYSQISWKDYHGHIGTWWSLPRGDPRAQGRR